MFDSDIIQKVWEKGIVVENYPCDLIRKDSCGAWIVRSLYGNKDNVFGWNIDHVYPQSVLLKQGVSLELIDDLLNLRPMNCANNASKCDSYPFYHSHLVSDGEKNVIQDSIFEVNKELQKHLGELYNGQ